MLVYSSQWYCTLKWWIWWCRLCYQLLENGMPLQENFVKCSYQNSQQRAMLFYSTFAWLKKPNRTWLCRPCINVIVHSGLPHYMYVVNICLELVAQLKFATWSHPMTLDFHSWLPSQWSPIFIVVNLISYNPISFPHEVHWLKTICEFHSMANHIVNSIYRSLMLCALQI